MNLDGFAPTPVVGNQYKKADGSKITVIAIDYVDGQLFVLYEENGEKSSVYQDGWNDMHLTEVRRRVVQPGGSVRDEDSVKKSNECGITMLCTGMRHFKH